jgi:hypothetical protein
LTVPENTAKITNAVTKNIMLFNAFIVKSLTNSMSQSWLGPRPTTANQHCYDQSATFKYLTTGP